MTWAEPLLAAGRDPVSMFSHLAGALLSVVLTIVLVRRARRHAMQGLGVAVYGLMMATAFSCSALFHYVEAGSPYFALFNKLDHTAIFLMIAGTGTAIYGSIDTRWARTLTGMLWAVSLSGSLLQVWLWPLPDWLSALLYLAVGWLGSVGILALGRATGWQLVRLFIYGAFIFSAGAVVFTIEWPSLWNGSIDAHAIFHLLVLAGAAFHAGFIYRHCTRRTLEDAVPSSELLPLL